MQCPKCNVTLNMAERQGIEIDYCPQCRGVWLDRGELDKIIERTISSEVAQSAPQQEYSRPADSAAHYSEKQSKGEQFPFGGGKKHKKHKKKHFLKEIFELLD
jgi:Zn-finger nucleic acid-binding protein